MPELEKATGTNYPLLANRNTVDIAIKVAEKHVEKQIELDLSIIRSAAYTLTKVRYSIYNFKRNLANAYIMLC